MNTIKIAIIGGTGKSGKYLVQELLNRNIPIKLLLRNTSHFEISNPLVEVVRGDARDYNAIYSLLDGCDGVISTLSQPIGEESIFGDATRSIIKAMEARGIKRYLVTAGLNVDVPGDEKSDKVRFATDWMYQNYPKTTKDRQVEYELISKSNLDWTFVRLPMIIQTEDCFPMKISLTDCPGDSISATDLANFLIDQFSSETYLKKSPFIANS
jgi:putative NADH-flavin reductase